jgi:elongation factor 1-beta
MAEIIVSLKVMPEGLEVDLKELKAKCKEKLEQLDCKFKNVEEQPIAFGLKALIFKFSRDEKLGSLDVVEEGLKEIKGVSQADVTQVGRAFG